LKSTDCGYRDEIQQNTKQGAKPTEIGKISEIEPGTLRQNALTHPIKFQKKT